jgi:predicted nucleotidyltransferase
VHIVRILFSIEERDAARDFVLKLAADDHRITAGAIVGSFARGAEDRWSDLDLTFAVADGVAIGDVIGDWTSWLESTLGAAALWDGQVGSRTYRVYLLPGSLQIDLSFTPASRFRPAGPAFELLFGEAGAMDVAQPLTAEHFFGWGAIQAIHARRSIERARYWQAEQAIGQVRECALSVACVEAGLDPSHGRGFDDLPSETLAAASATLVAEVEPGHLLRALGLAVELLLGQAATDVAARIEDELRALSVERSA